MPNKQPQSCARAETHGCTNQFTPTRAGHVYCEACAAEVNREGSRIRGARDRAEGRYDYSQTEEQKQRYYENKKRKMMDRLLSGQ